MDAKYLKATVGPCLTEGLLELVEKRPLDPIEYLGHWLLKYKENENFNIQQNLLMEKVHQEEAERKVEEERIERMKQEVEQLKQAEAGVLGGGRRWGERHVDQTGLSALPVNKTITEAEEPPAAAVVPSATVRLQPSHLPEPALPALTEEEEEPEPSSKDGESVASAPSGHGNELAVGTPPAVAPETSGVVVTSSAED